MGFEYAGVNYCSDYFEKTWEFALRLIREGKAYVDDLSQEEMRAYRGTLTTPGKNSPYRDRTPEENEDLFLRMTKGEFPAGSHTLRAKIDMASPNLNMRDPVMYRIMYVHHHRTGDKWCVYPMYDFSHPLGDALEGTTHSLCSLEYEAHRPLYNWAIDNVGFEEPPRQIEFARLNVTHMIMSKRYLRRLVEENYVSGWDDPRMPTLAGLRRRGYTAASILDFIQRAGIAKADSVVDIGLLEHCIREDLNETAQRAMAVLHPVPLTITNWEKGKTEILKCENHPGHPEMGERDLTFSGELFIEREDFMVDPPKKFFRLFPGGEVRLKSAYIIRCTGYDADEDGNVTHIYAELDPTSRSGEEGANRKVKGTLHWVDAASCVDAEVRNYGYLINEESAGEESEEEETEDLPVSDAFLRNFNHDSLEVVAGCKAERALADTKPGDHYQFIRQGYYVTDPDSTPEHLVFNRTVTLRDSWAKEQNRK